MRSDSPPIRVLLADEHEHVLRDLVELMNVRSRCANAVGAAHTVTETVFLLRACRPDVLVVADRLAGECVVAGLSRFIGAWRAAIIVRLGSDDARRRALALRNGADCVLEGDGRSERLLAAIEELRAGVRARIQ